jgi:hypothetical protein
MAELVALTDWFAERVAGLDDLRLGLASYRAGVSALSGPHAELAGRGFAAWSRDRGYRPTRHQLDVAYFAAASLAGRLVVDGRRLGPGKGVAR